MKLSFVPFVLLAATSQACINDRDTLAFEQRNVDILKGIKDATSPAKQGPLVQELALRAIGGRYERFPAPYYQMRIDRLKRKGHLEGMEWDDLAVAYQRIGKTEEAIKSILSSKSARRTQMEWYRFHANYGTFLVAKWVGDKDRDLDSSLLKQSIDEIKLALNLNPESHFGREKVQLALEESWLSDARVTWPPAIESMLGLSGIVMMGLGEEIPDVFDSISGFTRDLPGSAGRTQLVDFAALKAFDLVQQGHVAIKATLHKPTANKSYEALLADGTKVQKARDSYLAKRFAQGRHPDTDPTFWNEWVEPPYPVLKRDRVLIDWSGWLPIVFVIISGSAALGAILWTGFSRRRAKTSKS